jgi:hypothetical protein
MSSPSHNSFLTPVSGHTSPRRLTIQPICRACHRSGHNADGCPNLRPQTIPHGLATPPTNSRIRKQRVATPFPTPSQVSHPNFPIAFSPRPISFHPSPEREFPSIPEVSQNKSLLNSPMPVWKTLMANQSACFDEEWEFLAELIPPPQPTPGHRGLCSPSQKGMYIPSTPNPKTATNAIGNGVFGAAVSHSPTVCDQGDQRPSTTNVE